MGGENDVARKTWSKKCNVVSVDDGGKGTQARQWGCPLEAGKCREIASPQKSPLKGLPTP